MSSNSTTTDGWRGLPHPGWSELDLLAAVDHAARTGALGTHVLVGFDSRAGSREITQLIVNLLQHQQVSCRVAHAPAPTPAVGRLVNSDTELTAGVIVTASHNPPGYVGVKLRDDRGLGIVWDAPPGKGSLDYVTEQSGDPDATVDIAGHYAATIGRELTDAFAQFNGHLTIDTAHGAVGTLAAHLPALHWSRAQALPFFAGQTPDPALRPDADNVALKTLRASHDPARTLIAMVDGDGDRLVLYTATSGYIGSAEQTALLLTDGLPVQHLVSTVVAPRMLTATAKRCAPDITITETDIGFKHLVTAWRANQTVATLGMEPNGAFVWAPHPAAYFERDSLASLTTVLTRFPSVEALDSAVAALRRIHPHPQQILTVPTPLDPVLSILSGHVPDWELDRTRTNLATFTSIAGDHIAVRASGTEAVTRLYVEAPPNIVQELELLILQSA